MFFFISCYLKLKFPLKLKIQPLLSLNKRSPFWLKRRKTIRRVNHNLTKMLENPAFFMLQKPSITTSIFQMLKRMIPAFPSFLRKKNLTKVATTPQKQTLKEPEIVKAFCKSTNFDLVHAKNSTIIEFQELKLKSEIKNEIKSLRTKSKVLSTIPTQKAPKFFRFSNEMMLNLKGILKFQEKNMKKHKTSPNANSKELPWQIETRKRSKSLLTTVNLEETSHHANKTPEKFISMQNLRIQFNNEMTTPKAQDNELDQLLTKKDFNFSESSDSPSNKKMEIKSNEKLKGTDSPTSKNFLLVDNKEIIVHSFKKTSEETWKDLNQQTEEIMEKLKTANNQLLDLKIKLKLKKKQKNEETSIIC